MCSLTDIFTNIVHIGRDELRMSRQAIYVRQRSETQVNRANIQNIQVVKNRSFMRNKGHVFGVRTFTDSKNTLLGTCPEIYGYIK